MFRGNGFYLTKGVKAYEMMSTEATLSLAYAPNYTFTFLEIKPYFKSSQEEGFFCKIILNGDFYSSSQRDSHSEYYRACHGDVRCSSPTVRRSAALLFTWRCWWPPLSGWPVPGETPMEWRDEPLLPTKGWSRETSRMPFASPAVGEKHLPRR